MTEMHFEVVQGEYGEELAVKFEYNKTLVERVKRLRDDDNWEVTHCTPVYGDGDDFKYWSIDRTAESIQRFQEVVGYPVPDEVRPRAAVPDGGEGDVLLEVPEGSTRFQVRGGGGDVDKMLGRMLSYDNPDAEHSAMAPPRIELYDRERRCAAMGLLGRAEIAVEALGYSVETQVLGDRSGRGIETDWEFPHDLRSYQRDAVSSVLEQGGGVVGVPTGGGKTVIAMRLLDLLGENAIVFVHTKELLHQWADEVRDSLGVEPGVIGDGEWSEGPVTICTMQTLMSRGTYELEDYGVMVFDECHRTSAADTMNEIGLRLEATWRVGLSATPWRRISGAEMKIEGAVGGVAYDATAEDLIDDGFLSEPRFETIGHDGPTARGSSDYHEAYERCIEKSDPRNAAVVERASELARSGYKVLVNIDRVDQGQELTDAIDSGMGGATAAFLSGTDPSSRRERVMDDFAGDGAPDVLVSTLIKEGVDIPAMDAVILAHGGKSDISTLQVIGRALRTGGGRDHAVVADVADSGRFFGSAHRERQETMAEYYGDYYEGDVEPVDEDSTGEERSSLSDPMSEEEQDELEEWLGLD